MGTARSPKGVIGDQTPPFEASILEQLVGHTVAEIERELTIKTLNHFEGNRTRASVALGISVRCLRDKIHQFKAQGIDIPEPHPGPLHQRKN
jgi:DNA-binding NtrC family response regulator